ncbi:MAG: trimeric intracellular cation channel family protein [Candidatus Binataceae bacterium]
MTHIFLLVLDLGGTFVFAISGAAAAVKHRLDIFGVMVLSFAAGNAGGITRDLLIGAVPPAAIADWTYVGVSLLAGFLTFFGYSVIARLADPVLWFDAAGLAFFAVAGTQKALVHGLNPVMAALLGMLTGIGGGMLRDVLVNEIPTVLRADLYALAALACSVVVAMGQVLHIQPLVTTILGGTLCFSLRFMAIQYGWHLPGPHRQSRRNSDASASEQRSREV